MGSSRYIQECRETDWTDAKMYEKAEQLAKVIQYQGSLPDILGVQEIENANAARAMQEKLGYSRRALITNSPDRRGIDVALFIKQTSLH